MGLFANSKVGNASAFDNDNLLNPGQYELTLLRFWYEASTNPESEHDAWLKARFRVDNVLTAYPAGLVCPAMGTPTLPASNPANDVAIQMWSTSKGPALGSAKNFARVLAGAPGRPKSELDILTEYADKHKVEDRWLDAPDAPMDQGRSLRHLAWDAFLTSCVAEDGLAYEGKRLMCLARAGITKREKKPFTYRNFELVG